MNANQTPLEQLEAMLRAYTGGHRHDLLADTARKILALQPEHHDALALLSLAQYNLAIASSDPVPKLEEMLATVKRALASYPTDDFLYYMLYHYYLYQGGYQYVQARDAILEAIKLRPNAAAYYRQLGEIYLINREADKAAKHLSMAVTLDPLTAEYRSRLALALLRQHKIQESLAMAHGALADAPDDANVLDTVGMIYILTGDLDKADRFFRDAMKRLPTYNYFQKHIDWIKREQRDKQQREDRGLRYTPLYIRHKGSKRFFDEEAGDRPVASR